MNRRMVFYMVSRMIQAEAVLLLLPMGVSFLYGETRTALSFLITAAGAALLGTLGTLLFKPRDRMIFSKEGFIIVALAWLAMSAVGAVPFVLSGDIPNYIDALFETVSGLTTTGSSILRNVESLTHGALFWRSFTHWIGGMGVLVFVMAIFPMDSGRSIYIMRAEMPGPVVGKLVPRVRDTAKILYLIYIALTLVEVVFLVCGGMSLFEGFVHAFGTAGTGGFGIKANSIAGYSPYLQWVLAIFMLLFGVNFNLYYLLLIRRAKAVFKSTELWVYLGIVAAATTMIALNVSQLYSSVSETIRTSFFQVSSLITTTGYATADFNLWPSFSRGLIFLLLFLGGCAGSTAGGLKISRVIMLFKMIGRDLRQLLHPRSVSMVQLEGKKVEDKTLNGVGIYFALYCGCIALVFLLLNLDPFGFSFETNLTAAVTCFNNVGPGLGGVGPAGGFADYSVFSKLLLSLAMLFGRLEIYPILFALTPSTWTKK